MVFWFSSRKSTHTVSLRNRLFSSCTLPEKSMGNETLWCSLGPTNPVSKLWPLGIMEVGWQTTSVVWVFYPVDLSPFAGFEMQYTQCHGSPLETLNPAAAACFEQFFFFHHSDASNRLINPTFLQISLSRFVQPLRVSQKQLSEWRSLQVSQWYVWLGQCKRSWTWCGWFMVSAPTCSLLDLVFQCRQCGKGDWPCARWWSLEDDPEWQGPMECSVPQYLPWACGSNSEVAA